MPGKVKAAPEWTGVTLFRDLSVCLHHLFNKHTVTQKAGHHYFLLRLRSDHLFGAIHLQIHIILFQNMLIYVSYMSCFGLNLIVLYYN